VTGEAFFLAVIVAAGGLMLMWTISVWFALIPLAVLLMVVTSR
jgi:hypothetical protein